MASSRSSVKLGVGIGIFLLTLATAFIHLYLALTAIPYFGLNIGVMLFILNGLGYLGLLAALQLPIPQLARFRSAARWALVAFAAVTIVLFFVMAPLYDFIGYLDKAIEVALIALLLADAYTTSSESSGETSNMRPTGLWR
jgi:quinol-cytochrome oxidoreductase complex cytochrome b subunit